MKPKKGDSVKQQQQKSFSVHYLENPEWFSTLTLKPEGDIPLVTAAAAVCKGCIHS